MSTGCPIRARERSANPWWLVFSRNLPRPLAFAAWQGGSIAGAAVLPAPLRCFSRLPSNIKLNSCPSESDRQGFQLDV